MSQKFRFSIQNGHFLGGVQSNPYSAANYTVNLRPAVCAKKCISRRLYRDTPPPPPFGGVPGNPLFCHFLPFLAIFGDFRAQEGRSPDNLVVIASRSSGWPRHPAGSVATRDLGVAPENPYPPFLTIFSSKQRCVGVQARPYTLSVSSVCSRATVLIAGPYNPSEGYRTAKSGTSGRAGRTPPLPPTRAP